MVDPVSRAERAVAGLTRDRRQLVAVDGVDGAGKSTFANALAQAVQRPTVRASVDDFHNPQAVRYRRGRESPEGFYRDSFDLEVLVERLLAPFAAGERFRRRAFDHRADHAVAAPLQEAGPDAVLVLDGLFLHRSELRDWWDLSILLDVAPAVAAARLRARDGQPTRPRYVDGQALYFADARPAERASLILAW
jgi:uridine kinase